MICKNCGAHLRGHPERCTVCDTQLRKSKNTVAYVQDTKNPYNYNPLSKEELTQRQEENKKYLFKAIKIAVIVLFIFFGISFAIISFVESSPKEPYNDFPEVTASQFATENTTQNNSVGASVTFVPKATADNLVENLPDTYNCGKVTSIVFVGFREKQATAYTDKGYIVKFACNSMYDTDTFVGKTIVVTGEKTEAMIQASDIYVVMN